MLELSLSHPDGELFGRTLSAGTAGAGVSDETGGRVKVTESMADIAAPAIIQPRLVSPYLLVILRRGDR